MIMMADRKKTIAAILGPHPDAEKDKAPDASPAKIACEELIECLNDKDADGALEALRAIFQEFDSEPHEEGPHIGG